MTDIYNYSDYLAEVHGLSTKEHRDYIQCITVIRKHVLHQLETSNEEHQVFKARLSKLNTMLNIHEMMIRRQCFGRDTLELTRMN